MDAGNKLVKGPLALYEQMRLKIVELIEERRLQPHDPLPSEVELAALFGVSTRTSKEALIALAKEGIVYRMPRRGTFLAEAKGAGSAGSTGVRLKLAVVLPALDDYTGKIVEAAIEAGSRQDADIALYISGGEPEKEEEMIKEAAAMQEIGGVIWFPGNRKACSNEVLRLHLASFPIVIVDRAFREIDIPSVSHDHYQGAYELTSWLIDRGHRHIGFITEDIEGIMSREERYHGYLQALLDRGIPFSKALSYICADAPDADEERKRSELHAFLLEHPEMSAVFCANDLLANLTINTCVRAGIDVPGRLSVAGFTDSSVAQLSVVPITTVRKPPEPLGEAAVALLLERIRHPERTPQPVKQPTTLIVRESVAEVCT
ncbi:GntR family transcriptional regulator [Cohnella sp. GbtcB17]|uniref:GntR family transcriptional regulator n=1 Tax=Cohnella sp. GbtcB17 TaxID=2824762 RepID=UPI001C2F6BCC|nr:GntR family transcriptional regulator [Cohnella sp. GbtcB17]